MTSGEVRPQPVRWGNTHSQDLGRSSVQLSAWTVPYTLSFGYEIAGEVPPSAWGSTQWDLGTVGNEKLAT